MVAPGRVDGGSRAPVSGRGSRARPRTSWCCWSPWTSDRSVAAHPGHLAGGTHPLGHEPHDLARSAAHVQAAHARPVLPDRKSTRLNSSHVRISYAVFCLKKKRTASVQFYYRRKKTKNYE